MKNSRARTTAASLVILLLLSMLAPASYASAYDGHPKLIVILVIDQFRGDYIERYQKDLKGNGFRLFTEKGAYFTDCYYDYANTRTGPGHATIATAAYTNGHGIAGNDWWDLTRNTTRPVSSVEDERYSLVGDSVVPAKGASPRNLLASTLGDELRLATQGQSRVFGVSLKDSAAILPAGAAANAAYWIDSASGHFVTSSYYMGALPAWVQQFNSSDRAHQAILEAGATDPKQFFAQVGKTPVANSYELDFARALIQNEQLGKRPVTDLITISLSANDIMGHTYGPDSAEEREMVDTLDQQLDSFFAFLDKNVEGGLSNVWVALTADHGVAPAPSVAAGYGLPAATIDMKALTVALNQAINLKFSPGEKIEYMLPAQQLPYLSLDPRAFDRAGINEQEAEQAVLEALSPALATLTPPSGDSRSSISSAMTPDVKRPDAKTPDAKTPAASTPAAPTSKTAVRPPNAKTAAAKSTPKTVDAKTADPKLKAPLPQIEATKPPVRFPAPPMFVALYTRVGIAKGDFPLSEFGRMLAHSYSPNGGWWVMAIPEAFQMENYGAGHTNHFSPWSYDRHVPLALFGSSFAHGTYHGRVAPVDIVATFASLLGINQPSASIGQVLTQAVRAVPIVPTARTKHGVKPDKSQTDSGASPVMPATAPANPPAATDSAPQPAPTQTPAQPPAQSPGNAGPGNSSSPSSR